MAKSKKSNKWLALAKEMGFTEDKNTDEYLSKEFITQFQKDDLLQKIGGKEGIKSYLSTHFYKKYSNVNYFIGGLLGQFFTGELLELKFEAMENNPKNPIARFWVSSHEIDKEIAYPIIEQKLLNRENTHPLVFQACVDLFTNMIDVYYTGYNAATFITYNPAIAKLLIQLEAENYMYCRHHHLHFFYEKYNKERRFFYEAIRIENFYPHVTIEKIYGFIQGYHMGLYHATKYNQEKDLDYVDYKGHELWGAYLKGNADIYFDYTLNPTRIDINYVNIFRYFTDSEAAAVALFYELLEKYKNRTTDTISNLIRSTIVNAYNTGQRHFEKEWNLTYSNFDNVDFSGATFTSCWFGHSMKNANLEGVKFIHCELRGTNMEGSNLKNATIENSVVEDLSLFNTNTDGIIFHNNQRYMSEYGFIADLELYKQTKHE